MRIFNKDKTQELNRQELNFELGYLKADSLFIAHHDEILAQKAIYQDRIVEEKNGGISVYKDLVSPAVEAKDAYDEIEEIQVYIPFTEEELKEHKLILLRRRREIECFPIINRGKLWYDTLTEEQRNELNAWYQAWLDITDTLDIPIKPEWIR